jgi:hypothetical protein
MPRVPPPLPQLDVWAELNQVLISMGFVNVARNHQLLIEHDGDLEKVVAELLGDSAM